MFDLSRLQRFWFVHSLHTHPHPSPQERRFTSMQGVGYIKLLWAFFFLHFKGNQTEIENTIISYFFLP